MKKGNSKKKMALWKKILIAILAIGIIGAIGSGNKNEKSNNSDSSKDKTNETVKTSDNEETKENLGVYETELISGNYIAGTDFPAGRYNIEAVSGNGNVSTSNMYSGGLNEIMGVDSDDLYTKEFKNAKLSNGVTISVSGVTIKITSTEDVNLDDQGKRAADESKSISLSNGNYIAGTDFDAGTYTIEAISGNGNISSSNMYDGGLNAIMGTDNDGFYEPVYKNIELPKNTELSISGGLEVKLTPVN